MHSLAVDGNLNISVPDEMNSISVVNMVLADVDPLLLASPILYAGKRMHEYFKKDKDQQKLEIAELKGKVTKLTDKDGKGAGVAAIIGLFIFLLIVGGLVIYPLIKAFNCPNNGVLWALLIILCPILGIVFLFVGCSSPALSQGSTTTME